MRTQSIRFVYILLKKSYSKSPANRKKRGLAGGVRAGGIFCFAFDIVKGGIFFSLLDIPLVYKNRAGVIRLGRSPVKRSTPVPKQLGTFYVLCFRCWRARV